MKALLVKTAIGLGLLCALPALASAQGWQPTRSIKMICPYPAGGGTDQIARIVALQLSKRLGQQVVVENRGGAGGAIGAKAIADAGAFAVVIEALAELLAARITKEIPIPTIGIGASAECDGQILVLEDMLGLSPRVPKFVKEYAQIGAGIEAAVKAFATEVRTRAFPTADYTYPMCDEVGEVTKKTKMTGS